MKIDFENFLSKPIEEKVRNPFFLALIVSIFHYNKKFIFTVFLPAEDWQQRWMYLGEYWIKAGFWDYVVVVLWAIGFTIAFYAAAYVTYVIAMIYDKRLRPWIGNLIYKKGFVERLEHEKLRNSHEILERKHYELIEETRELKTNDQIYKDSIITQKRVFAVLEKKVMDYLEDTLKTLVTNYKANASAVTQGNSKISDKLISESSEVFGDLKMNVQNIFNEVSKLEDVAQESGQKWS
ncbi:MAG: hypothetical protein MJA30_33835 [Cytophagales bacterium]|nr:hypothetical protein [Cytophagales bacterium]